MLGYFSGEWLFLATLGLGSAAVYADNIVAKIESATARWVVALLISVILYGVLRLAGRTPIGITYAAHPAARGHPVLSLVASTLVFAVFGFYIWKM